MSAISTIQKFFFQRTSAFALTIVGVTFFFERGFDIASESLFDYLNKGKQWKDIKHRYVEE